MTGKRIERPMVTREFVEAMRRDHIATALARLCLERGFPSVTVADITRRAEMSRVTFYQVFSSSDDCFVFLVTSAVEELSEVVEGSFSSRHDVEEQVLAATRAAFGWLAANEARASVLLVDVHGGPPEARRAQLALFDSLAERLARARRSDEEPTANALEQMLLGGTVAVLRRLSVDGEISRAPEYAPDLALLMARLPMTGD